MVKALRGVRYMCVCCVSGTEVLFYLKGLSLAEWVWLGGVLSLENFDMGKVLESAGQEGGGDNLGSASHVFVATGGRRCSGRRYSARAD